VRRTGDDLESPGRAVINLHLDASSVASGTCEHQSEGSTAAAVGVAANVCRVAVLGAPKVGKTTLARQLLTSEYLANKDNYHGQKKSFFYLVIVLLVKRNNYVIIQFMLTPDYA